MNIRWKGVGGTKFHAFDVPMSTDRFPKGIVVRSLCNRHSVTFYESDAGYDDSISSKSDCKFCLKQIKFINRTSGGISDGE